jgi:hypothetical protein
MYKSILNSFLIFFFIFNEFITYLYYKPISLWIYILGKLIFTLVYIKITF